MAGKERSPNYPGIGLEEAIALTRALYGKEGRSAVPVAVAFKSMGYKSASGTAKSHLGALRAYGLIEGSRGVVKLSERGLLLMVMPPEEPDFQSALRAAALDPPIFRELYESKAEASPDTLRHHLVLNRKFREDAANRLIRVHKENLAVAGLDKTQYDVSVSPTSVRTEVLVPSVSVHTTGIPSDEAVGQPTVFTDTQRWRLTPTTVVELRIAGKLDPPAMERLKRYMDLLAESISADSDSLDDEAPE